MEAIRIQQVMSRNGEVVITGLPYRKGQLVEIILLPQPVKTPPPPRPRLTVGQFRELGLIGLWKDRCLEKLSHRHLSSPALSAKTR